MIMVHLLMLLVASLLGLFFSYMAITEKDLLKAIAYSAGQGVAYSILFYLLMAPDVVLAYIAIAVGIYSALLVFVVSKTTRYEED
ncbi:MAG: sodium:proton antiporter [Desulfurococcales archaeon ex4484_58]|nr:MAG: sodium:proton antiporter [Desulfurococcales archaeon ex4484_58]